MNDKRNGVSLGTETTESPFYVHIWQEPEDPSLMWF